MHLRGIEYGTVLGASGVQGFFGEGYWFHHIYSIMGMSFSDVIFVTKTATFNPNVGNMPLTQQYMPRKKFPECVKVSFRKGTILNAVGLSNPGLPALLATGLWQKRTEPFFISITSSALSSQKRLEEFAAIVDTIGKHKCDFSAPFALQVNLSCPNTEDLNHSVDEHLNTLTLLGTLDVPVMPKYSVAFTPADVIMPLNDHPHCDAICVSNTIPFGWHEVDWKKLWGNTVSPIAHFGGGGLSGKPLADLVCGWITRTRDAGFTKPINGGGGILHVKDVDDYHAAGASSVFIGSVAILRPWRIRSIINRAHCLVWV